MVFLEAVFLGLVQGVTEFLPISSTAHLILLERFFHLSPAKFGLAFDVALHLGTLLALLLFFGRDFCCLRKKSRSYNDFRLIAYLLLATAPAALIGFLLEKRIESTFRDPFLITASLLGGSAIFYLAEKLKRPEVVLSELGWRRSLFLGFAQAAALMPGVSRSGIIISAGLVARMGREGAGYFAFLMSVPIILGAGVKKIWDIYRLGFLEANLIIYLLGFSAAALSGYLCVRYFLNFLKKHSLLLFIYYRVILAALVVFAVRFLGW